jgi:hypothetical protein
MARCTVRRLAGEASLYGAGLRAASDEADALRDLHGIEATDGLPVVIPTEARVERMVLASGLDGDLSLGTIPPADGEATVAVIAANAVMAGCEPDQFPVVLAAVGALCDPVLDMGEVQATTHCLAPLVIVNGPARHDCGSFESGIGALGPGNGANAVVGRAVRLCLINIGGGRAGTSDMALLGHPGKFTYCLAEAEEESCFEPLHVRRGFRSDQSVVTLFNVEAPHSVILIESRNRAGSADRLLTQLAYAVGNPASNSAIYGLGNVPVILNPAHARLLYETGYSIPRICEELARRSAHPRGQLMAMEMRPEENEHEVVGVGPEQLHVIIAGGEGVYSAVAPAWGAGAHGNQAVSALIQYGSSCAIPVHSGK